MIKEVLKAVSWNLAEDTFPEQHQEKIHREQSFLSQINKQTQSLELTVTRQLQGQE